MNHDNWTAIQDLFHRAIDLHPSKLEAFYQGQSEYPAEVLEQVKKLVAQDRQQHIRNHTLSEKISNYGQDHVLPQVEGYEVISLIAHGGMGSVYLAQDTRLSRRVAIKLLHPHLSRHDIFKQRFMREARAAARLQHENISTIYEIDESSNGQIHIASAYCPGKNLSERIRQRDLSLPQIINIMHQLLSALKEAHGLGIVHRDLKPENIIVDAHNQIKLVDFGIAKIRDEHQTSSGEIIGTPAYMSPEQFRGEAIDPLTDIWAVGMVLYEMLEGKTPFEGKTAPEIMYQMLYQPIPYNAEHQLKYQPLYDIIQHCLNIDKALRPSTVEHIQQMLQKAQLQLESSEHFAHSPEYPIMDEAMENASHPSITTQRNILILYLFGTDSDITWQQQQIAHILVKKYRGEVINHATEKNPLLIACFGYPFVDDMSLRNGLQCALAWVNATPTNQAFASYQKIEDSGHSRQPTLPTVESATLHPDAIKGFNSKHSLWINQPLLDVLPESLLQPLQATALQQQAGYFPVAARADTSDHPFTLKLSPFTGREAQLALIQENWQQALEGDLQRVLISGEAGIGKSRLIYEFKHQLDQPEHCHLVELFCSPYEQSSTYYPILSYLRKQLPVAKPNQIEIEHFINDRIQPQALDCELLCQLLGVALSEQQLAQLPSGDLLNRKYQSLLGRLLAARPAGFTTLLIIEDLHWIDQATSLIVENLLQSASLHATLIVLSCRPQYKPGWMSHVVTSNLYLSKLRQAQSEKLLKELIHSAAEQQTGELDQHTISHMAERTGGNPLFIEELAKSASLNQDDDSVVPGTIQDTLIARLDRLGSARELAQVAAVIGRHFNIALLKYCSNSSELDFRHQFDTLVRAGIFYQDESPERWYFKHALIRDAAYQTIQLASRQALHSTIARAIEEIDKQLCQTQPSLLAQHWENANHIEKAVFYWQQSAQKNLSLFSISLCIEQCQHALELSQQLDNDIRDNSQLAIYATLGPALMNRYGYADERAGDAYSRALSLSKQIHHGTPNINILFGNWTYRCVRAEHMASLALSQQMIKISEAGGKRDEICESYMVQGIGDFYRGNFLDARKALQSAIDHYDSAASSHHITGYGQDAFVATTNFQSWNELALGNPQQAQAYALKSVEVARKTRHPMTLAYALSYACYVFMNIADFEAAERLVEESIQVCEENEVILFLGLSLILRALLCFQKNEIEQGEKEMAHASEVYLPTGAQIMIPNFLLIQAEVLLKAGRIDEAEAMIDQSLSIIETSHENWCLAPALAVKFIILTSKNECQQADEYLQRITTTLDEQHAHGIRMLLIQKGLPLDIT